MSPIMKSPPFFMLFTSSRAGTEPHGEFITTWPTAGQDAQVRAPIPVDNTYCSCDASTLDAQLRGALRSTSEPADSSSP